VNRRTQRLNQTRIRLEGSNTLEKGYKQEKKDNPEMMRDTDTR